jgi:Zn-dependent protease
MFGSSNKSWKLFTVFGHDVFVTPWFLVLIALFSFMGLRAGAGFEALENLIIWAPILFGGILFHELGHAVALQAYGYGGSRIELHGFGGVTINQRRGQSPPGRSIVISLAGPFASLLLGLLSAGVLMLYTGSGISEAFAGGGLLLTFLQWMVFVNIGWAIFNMLPINPMDGGHVVLHGLRWKLDNNRKAMRYSAISSLVFIALLVPLVFALGYAGGSLLWILLLVAMFGMQNWRIIKATNANNQRRPRGF